MTELRAIATGLLTLSSRPPGPVTAAEVSTLGDLFARLAYLYGRAWREIDERKT